MVFKSEFGSIAANAFNTDSASEIPQPIDLASTRRILNLPERLAAVSAWP
jgi:hypothetical protein